MKTTIKIPFSGYRKMRLIELGYTIEVRLPFIRVTVDGETVNDVMKKIDSK